MSSSRVYAYCRFSSWSLDSELDMLWTANLSTHPDAYSACNQTNQNTQSLIGIWVRFWALNVSLDVVQNWRTALYWTVSNQMKQHLCSSFKACWFMYMSPGTHGNWKPSDWLLMSHKVFVFVYFKFRIEKLYWRPNILYGFYSWVKKKKLLFCFGMLGRTVREFFFKGLSFVLKHNCS